MKFKHIEIFQGYIYNSIFVDTVKVYASQF